MREQSNKRVWNEAENGERDLGRDALPSHALQACEARALRVLLRHALPISLLILRKKPECFAVYVNYSLSDPNYRDLRDTRP